MKLKIKKTSNVLIIGLIAFVVVSTVLLFADDKANAGKNRSYGQYEYTEHTDTLSQNFSVIVVDMGSKANITKGETNTITYHTIDKENKREVCKVQNDTLYIIDANAIRVTISYSGEISHLILKDESSVDITGSSFEKLDITTNGSNRIRINGSKFAALNTMLNNTQMYFDNSTVNIFNVTLENESDINGNLEIDTLNAIVNTNSSLRLSSKNIANVYVKTDKSGDYNIQQYR